MFLKLENCTLQTPVSGWVIIPVHCLRLVTAESEMSHVLLLFLLDTEAEGEACSDGLLSLWSACGRICADMYRPWPWKLLGNAIESCPGAAPLVRVSMYGLRQQQCSVPQIYPSFAGSQTDCLWCCTCPGWRPGPLGPCSEMLRPQSCLLQASKLWGRCRDRALPCLLLSGAGRSDHYYAIHSIGLPFLVKSLQHVVTCTSV